MPRMQALPSGEDEILAHRFHHFPRAFHARLDDENITGLEVNGRHAVRGDDAVALLKYWLLFIY